MKIRSKALYQYLLQAGVLNGPEEAVALAKRTYRKEYKRQWKRQSRPQKEIRFAVTLKQFATIRAEAQALSMSHTAYSRRSVLACAGLPPSPNEELLEVLQLVSMAAIATAQDKKVGRVQGLLEQAELSLLRYIKIIDT